MLPGVRIRLRDDEAQEIDGLEESGEIEVASPSGLRGYIDHASEALLPPAEDDKHLWWPTGDVGLFRLSPSGEQHLFVVDRIRDMIKVKVSSTEKTKFESIVSKTTLVNNVLRRETKSLLVRLRII